MADELSDEIEFQKELEEHGYNLIGLIGQGGCGKVYQVWNPKYRQFFVAKIQPKNGIFGFAEAATMKNVWHPNIICFYDYFEIDELFCIILEFCPNGTLQELIADKPVLVRNSVLNYAFQIINAINFCHIQGIAHRDIKPSNIFLDEHYRPKLADFGLSDFFAPEQISHQFFGSIPFLAPEILLRQPYNPFKADIWALGVTLYYILTGQLPWLGNTPEEMRKNIIHGFYKPIIHDGNHVTDEITKVIYLCLKINPDQRPSCSQILNLGIFKKTKIPATSSAFKGIQLNMGQKKDKLKISKSLVMKPVAMPRIAPKPTF